MLVVASDRIWSCEDKLLLGVAGKCSTSQKSKNEGIEFETTTEGFKTCSIDILYY
jgi:hypothetical protein